MKVCEKSLFVITVGPVSSFIEGSRKMRDLYAGSFLLSFLTYEVLREIRSNTFPYKDHLEVIFPGEENNHNSVPNRIVGITDMDEEGQRKLGTYLEQYFWKIYKKVCAKILNLINFKETDKDDVYKAIWNQLRSMLHVYWTFVPLTNGYSKDYPLLVSKINQVKSIRCFTQLREPAYKKCSLYPQFNVLIKNTSSHNDNQKSDHSKDENSPMTINLMDLQNENIFRYAIKEKEQLSAFGFIKRAMAYADIEDYDRSIKSVAYMLAKHYIGKKCPDSMNDLLPELISLEEKGGIEAIFDLQNNQQLTTNEYSGENIELAYRLYKQLSENEIKLKYYYAFVKFDGDGFGNLYKEHADAKIHQEFSHNIIKFSRCVKKIIEKYDGVCIFAGGEDFLGFLPVDNIFSALYELREKFQEMVRFPGYEKDLTFSAGITIAHYMEPLSEVIKYTFEMEECAKHIDSEKDAFAIKLMKRSGEELTVCLKFGPQGKTLNLINDVGRMMMDAGTSKRLFLNLIHVLSPLENDSGLKEEMVRTLIKYAVQKSDLKNSQEIISALYELYSLSKGDVEAYCHILNFLSFWIRECCEI